MPDLDDVICDMDVFDRLPLRVRRVMNAACTGFDVVQVATILHKHGEVATVEEMILSASEYAAAQAKAVASKAGLPFSDVLAAAFKAMESERARLKAAARGEP